MGKTIGVIQARMASSPLPGKILAPLADRPLLDLLFARIESSRVDEWWLATSSDPSDDVTEAWGFELGLRVSRGDGADVLGRFVAIGAETQAKWIVRSNADQPFLDAGLIDQLLDVRDSTREAKGADLLQHHGGLPIDAPDTQDLPKRDTVLEDSPKLPIGYSVQLIRRAALDRAASAIPDCPGHRHHRVHVTRWLRANAEVFDVPAPSEWPNRPHWRWTLDTYEDLAMARSAFRLFGRDSISIDYPTMVARLDVHPEITAMNLHVREKTLEAG